MITNTNNKTTEYRIYIRSNENPRTINTPTNGRAYYTRINVYGKPAFVEKLNELHRQGAQILEVRCGCIAYVKYWEYIASLEGLT